MNTPRTPSTDDGWLLPGAVKDTQSVDASWEPVGTGLIDGVVVRDVRHVPSRRAVLTEVLRRDWFDAPVEVDHVFQVTIEPGGVSAWHAHGSTVDRIFVTSGMLQVVLYDARPGSPTMGQLNRFYAGESRPMLIVVPARVWHGVGNHGRRPATVLNLPDRAYAYADPDHWRLPPNSPEVPFSFDSQVTPAF